MVGRAHGVIVMSLASEFKAFVLRGNVVDLAVGLIIGAAFGGIVSSLVADILMPPIGYLANGVNFSDLSIDLPAKATDPKFKGMTDAELAAIPDSVKLVPVKIGYGKFLQKVFDFLIVAACLFFIIQAMNRLKKKEAAAPTEPSASDRLLTEIRDELRKR